MQSRTYLFRRIALTGYFGLLTWVICWHFVLTETSTLSPGLLLFMWVLPLLFPLHGLVKGKPYTHAWANFIVMIYLLHGFTAIYAVSSEWLYALIEIVFSVIMFIGCSFYARLRGRELGGKLKKLKDELAEEKAHFEARENETN